MKFIQTIGNNTSTTRFLICIVIGFKVKKIKIETKFNRLVLPAILISTGHKSTFNSINGPFNQPIT